MTRYQTPRVFRSNREVAAYLCGPVVMRFFFGGEGGVVLFQPSVFPPRLWTVSASNENGRWGTGGLLRVKRYRRIISWSWRQQAPAKCCWRLIQKTKYLKFRYCKSWFVFKGDLAGGLQTFRAANSDEFVGHLAVSFLFWERITKIRGRWTASVHCCELCLFWEAFVFCSGAGTVIYVLSFVAVHKSCHRSGQTRKQALQYSSESFEFETIETVRLPGRRWPTWAAIQPAAWVACCLHEKVGTDIMYIINCALLLRRICRKLIRKFPRFAAVKNCSRPT